jgi:hypothetical protein
MATTLNIDVSDQEQAYIENAVVFLGATLTPTEVKQWLEARGKQLLRNEVVRLVEEQVRHNERASEEVRVSELNTAWPEEPFASPVTPSPAEPAGPA